MKTQSSSVSQKKDIFTIIPDQNLESDGIVKLCKVQVDPDYLKKMNESSLQDFVVLVLNGQVLRNTLYRVGGLNSTNPQKDKYFQLLKYTEEKYSRDFAIKHKLNLKNRNYLDSSICFLNQKGDELHVDDLMNSPNLFKDSCIFSTKGVYYNIETKERYCSSSNKFETSEFLFLNNLWDRENPEREGVFKICKKTGEYEIFKK